MLAKVESRAIHGISARKIDVEIDISSGIPSFSIVGLPDASCRESSKRVVTALRNSGFRMPSKRITVNLAPAYFKKEGSLYDLAIAVGILAALGKIDVNLLKDRVVCGELSLDGCLHSIKGVLPIADDIKRRGGKELLIPFNNLNEASSIKGIKILGVRTLNEALKCLSGGETLMPEREDKRLTVDYKERYLDYSDIRANLNAKRAMEIAAAGRHNILLIGPPGVGKTMLARRLSSILGQLTEDESVQTTKIYSVAGLLKREEGLIRRPPFRILHHSISDAGMIGGGTNARPGEISLAHNGVLFLDELTEFRRDVLEILRQPLEEGTIRISRANYFLSYPAEFMLVAAMNPCPCGFLTHPEKGCSCTPPQIQRYLSKVSGPLLDRIDMHIEVPPIRYEDMRQKQRGEGSKEIRGRVMGARARQKRRYQACSFKVNAKLPHRLLDKLCPITDEAAKLLKKAMSELFLSARAYGKILKVARTIADIDKRPIIGIEEISEAIGYRCLDSKMWFS